MTSRRASESLLRLSMLTGSPTACSSFPSSLTISANMSECFWSFFLFLFSLPNHSWFSFEVLFPEYFIIFVFWSVSFPKTRGATTAANSFYAILHKYLRGGFEFSFLHVDLALGRLSVANGDSFAHVGRRTSSPAVGWVLTISIDFVWPPWLLDRFALFFFHDLVRRHIQRKLVSRRKFQVRLRWLVSFTLLLRVGLVVSLVINRSEILRLRSVTLRGRRISSNNVGLLRSRSHLIYLTDHSLSVEWCFLVDWAACPMRLIPTVLNVLGWRRVASRRELR